MKIEKGKKYIVAWRFGEKGPFREIIVVSIYETPAERIFSGGYAAKPVKVITGVERNYNIEVQAHDIYELGDTSLISDIFEVGIQ
jgi:hypothetical protein